MCAIIIISVSVCVYAICDMNVYGLKSRSKLISCSLESRNEGFVCLSPCV